MGLYVLSGGLVLSSLFFLSSIFITFNNTELASTPIIPNFPPLQKNLEAVPVNSIRKESKEDGREKISPVAKVTEALQIKNIIISEIFFNPGGADEGKEFIRLNNLSPEDVDLKSFNLRISKGNGMASLVKIGSNSQDRTQIKAGGYLLIGLNNYSGDADLKRSASLPNSGRTIYLYDTQDVEIDEVTYSESTPEGFIYKRDLIKGFYDIPIP